MSVKRTALASAVAFALLALPTTTGLGPDLSFAKGDGGGDGGGGGHGNGGDAGAGGGGAGGAGAGGAGGGAAAGGAGAGGVGTGGSGSAGASGAGAGGNGGGGGKDNGSIAAFFASPVFAHVATTVPTTITASPVVVSNLGVPCQTITQTINIGGQDVYASAVLCQQRNGSWQIDRTQSARVGSQMSMPIETSSLSPSSIDK
jgi:hypothetical protein